MAQEAWPYHVVLLVALAQLGLFAFVYRYVNLSQLFCVFDLGGSLLIVLRGMGLECIWVGRSSIFW